MPSVECAFGYLLAVRNAIRSLIQIHFSTSKIASTAPHSNMTSSPGRIVITKPILTYLIHFSVLHEKWHIEDIILCRHLQSIPAPLPFSPSPCDHSELILLSTISLEPPPQFPSLSLSDSLLPDETILVDLYEDCAIPGGDFFLGAERDLLSYPGVVIVA
jgi:hypothetical protein